MLVSPGQPVEIERRFVDLDGQPVDPSPEPAALAVACGRSYPLLDVLDGQAVPCAVRRIELGRFAARVPAAVLQTIGPGEVRWAWTDDGDQRATDPLEVTPLPVATPDDLARLPGDKARSDISLQDRLRALSSATRDFEHATNLLFSPRLQIETCPPGRVLDPIDVLTRLTSDPVDLDGTVTYVFDTGRAVPPEDVTRAVALLASARMADGPWDDRGYAITDDGGGVRLLTAGVGRAMFSIPDVEAVAKRWRVPGMA